MLAAKNAFDKLTRVLSEDDFRYFSRLIHQLAGIHITDKKRDLVASRLGSFIQKNGIDSFSDYRRRLEGLSQGHSDFQTFINLITTNKTDFFREPQHFSYLAEKIVPDWIDKKVLEPRIWCCACSTGEEPYTISMVLNRYLPPDFNYKICATDIDTQVLARAKNGVYENAKLPEIPDFYREQYLKIGRRRAEGWFRIQDQIYQKIDFKRYNLIEDQSVCDEKFDVIFCRNVLIYFETSTIRHLMMKLHRSLKPEGLLFIGHSESIQGNADLFKGLAPSVYRKI